MKAEGAGFTKWNNGATIDGALKKWKGAEPKPTAEASCVIMSRRTGTAYDWHPAKCSGHAAYICKMEREWKCIE